MAQNKNRKPLKLHKLSLLVITLGVMLGLYPLFTFVYSNYQQNRLQANLENPVIEQPTGDAIPEEQQSPSGDNGTDNSLDQEALFRLEIPKLELTTVVVKGTSPTDLKKGPGWYENSVLPGEGNTAIAGHRTMHGGWFRHVDKLKEKDLILLSYQNREYIYEVEKVFPIAKNDWSVIDPTEHSVLTLTTCHPVGSAKQRLVVRAILKSSLPTNDR
jgi:sortase A